MVQGRALMSPYLPHNGSVGSPFSEGGALYALGLIHANHGQDIRSFLLESLGNTSNEVGRSALVLFAALVMLRKPCFFRWDEKGLFLKRR